MVPKGRDQRIGSSDTSSLGTVALARCATELGRTAQGMPVLPPSRQTNTSPGVPAVPAVPAVPRQAVNCGNGGDSPGRGVPIRRVRTAGTGGDHLGTTRRARPRATCVRSRAPERVASGLTCGNAYPNGLGVKGSQVQILSARPHLGSEQRKCRSEPDVYLCCIEPPPENPPLMQATARFISNVVGSHGPWRSRVVIATQFAHARTVCRVGPLRDAWPAANDRGELLAKIVGYIDTAGDRAAAGHRRNRRADPPLRLRLGDHAHHRKPCHGRRRPAHRWLMARSTTVRGSESLAGAMTKFGWVRRLSAGARLGRPRPIVKPDHFKITLGARSSVGPTRRRRSGSPQSGQGPATTRDARRPGERDSVDT
ncbi:hypothetical protein EV385_0580 [Krasilnikovia cinnamomea]|uniref:Uncharacterized protein n=1 Tax=Krasilnikovia cinnamomea TaxID=349313 RepID=A0A4Q7ZF01_9ACTN|nr:hypothetical protein EV385_0580 [Krasilnikovia cinnamomea]